MDFGKEFNKYLADIAVMTVKLHNLHWNVEGETFMSIHKFTESEYEKFFDRMDAVAEIFRMFDVIPCSTMKEFLEITNIEEIPARKFGCKEVLKIYLKDIELLKAEAIELRKYANEKDWFMTVDLLEDHVNDYNKQIWFVKASLQLQ